MTRGEELQQARNRLTDELRTTSLLAVLMVLIATVAIAAVIGTLAMVSMFWHYSRLEDMDAMMKAQFSEQDARIERSIKVMEQNTNELRKFYGAQQ